MKIVTIVGARPQFVKAAMVSRHLGAMNVEEIVVHTGQHYDVKMSDVFFDQLCMPAPAYNLGIGGGTHGENTGRMLEGIEAVLLKERPSWVLVYGDTDSTLAGALAACKLHIPVAHVEAGLRSFNRNMPEEVNRVLTDHASKLLLAPTEVGMRNLAAEGISGRNVRNVGDVMYDAALHFGELARAKSTLIADLDLRPGTYVLATVHRAENTDDPTRLKAILDGLSASAFPIVLPLHPRTRARLAEFGLAAPSTVTLIDPVGYFDMIELERNAVTVATDSGGVQKEAYFYGVRCVTLRDETEWTELVASGANVLVGADAGRIAHELSSGKADPGLFHSALYGKGDAARKIAEILVGDQRI